MKDRFFLFALIRRRGNKEWRREAFFRSWEMPSVQQSTRCLRPKNKIAVMNSVILVSFHSAFQAFLQIPTLNCTAWYDPEGEVQNKFTSNKDANNWRRNLL
ncbi:hypothetical protein NPIL_399121 [Nephila pilipes]|uniref:Uncharacterized protein n=1 Tax=Nephila pilipes TaxID=299642 RepID=A0A8X6URN1_NEPPI|nr:hypothetical protein NPIL_399121 [Nephila pilipes]